MGALYAPNIANLCSFSNGWVHCPLILSHQLYPDIVPVIPYRCANSSSGPSRRRWACSPSIPIWRGQSGQRVVTPSGMVLDGRIDNIEVAFEQDATTDGDGDGVVNEIPLSIVDFMEFYLLNYFKAGTYRQTTSVATGRSLFSQIGCAQCHIPDLQINRDRRVADVETVFDIQRGIFNDLFATASRCSSKPGTAPPCRL